MTVSEAKENLGLIYEDYAGFYKSGDNISEIQIQLKNQPLFLGSDNNNEEDYLDSYVAGITFNYPLDEMSTDSLRNNIEEIYNAKFESISTLEKADYVENVDTMKFYKMNINKSIILIIKEKNYRLIEKEFTSMTIYYNLTEKELIEFVTHIY